MHSSSPRALDTAGPSLGQHRPPAKCSVPTVGGLRHTVRARVNPPGGGGMWRALAPMTGKPLYQQALHLLEVLFKVAVSL